MSSFDAIHEFMESNDLEGDEFGHLSFNAFIEYRSPMRNASEITDVKILRNGIEEGKIILSENGELVVADYHLDFTVRFQEYESLGSGEKLLISGDSQKMGGEYTVTITPV